MEKQGKAEEIFEGIFEFLKKYRKGIFYGIVAVLIVVIVIIFVSSRRRQKLERASFLFEKGYNLYIRGFSSTNQQQQSQLYDSAASQFLSAVDTYPESTPAVRARLYLARIYYDRGKYDTAIGYLQEIPDVSKSEFYVPLSYLFLAECYLQKNDIASASEFYGRIYREYPDTGFGPSAMVGLAVCRELMGNSDDAKTIFSELTNRYPDSAWVNFALENIAFFDVKKELGVKATPPSAQSLKGLK